MVLLCGIYIYIYKAISDLQVRAGSRTQTVGCREKSYYPKERRNCIALHIPKQKCGNKLAIGICAASSGRNVSVKYALEI